MNIARKIALSILLGWIAVGLCGCEDTPTSNPPPVETGKPSEKAGPSISLSVVQSSPYSTSYSLKGSVGKSGSVSVYAPTLTLDGVDRSSDFSFPSSISKMADAPYDLGGIYFSAKTSARPGVYLLTMSASDSTGTSRATCTLSVRYKSLEATGNGSSIFPGAKINLSGTTHFPEDYATLSFQVVPQETSITLPATIQVTNGPWSSASVATSPSTPLGNYRVVVSLKRQNGNVDTVSVPLTVVEKTTPLISEGSLDMGTQKDYNGSYLDVANATCWTSGAAKPYQTLDVVLSTDSSGTPSFASPDQAAIEGNSIVLAWPTRNRTIIVDAGSSQPASAEAIRSAIGSSSSQKAAVVVGHWYALRLSTGQFAALKVTSLTNSNNRASVQIYNTELYDRGGAATPAQVALGTQTSTAPSFLDVANQSAIQSASKSYSKVDLVFFKDATGIPSFLSPYEAANQGLGGLNTWTTKNMTTIVDAGTSELATLDAVKAVIGSSSSQKAPVIVGHVYALKLSSGGYATLKVTSLSGGTDVNLLVSNL